MNFLPFPNPEYDSQSQSESSSLSLHSLPSLPSVPSLSSPPHHHQLSTSTAVHHCLTTLKGHSSSVFSLALAGKTLYSGSSDKNIHVSNNLSTNNVVAVGNGAVKSLVVLDDKLISAHQDHKIRIWKIDKDHDKYYSCTATLPLVSDRIQTLFSSRNYVETRRHKKSTWVNHVDAVSSLALSKDGFFLYSASWDRTFKIWRMSDFKCVESVSNAHDDAINTIVLSNDGFVYTGSADKKIKVWKKDNVGDKKHVFLATLEKHKSAVNALALNNDGSVLYSGACDRSIIVWERGGGGGGSGEDMTVVGALRGHSKAILCLVVVDDLVCSGSADKTVRIWRRGYGGCYSSLAVFEGHNGPVKCLTGSVDNYSIENNYEDGNSYLVYSGSLDCHIKCWQLWVPHV